MEEKIPDPKKVAHRLAGGTILQSYAIRFKDSQWALTSNQKAVCPYCGEENRGFFKGDEETIRCKHCKKEIRILSREEIKVDTAPEVDEEVIRILADNMMSGKFKNGFSISCTTNLEEDPEKEE
jgi:hypothetical protein